jgi:Holliday junction resolvase RusA-like endonuclease
MPHLHAGPGGFLVIEVIVRGIPAPQGSKRHVGNGRMIESSKAVGPWREAVRATTQTRMYARPPLSGPVAVRAWFWLPRPNGHYRTGRNAHLLRDAAPLRPFGKPDLDKLVRAVLDGLTDGGAWKDDGQVVELTARKLYVLPGLTPGAKIEITEVAG